MYVSFMTGTRTRIIEDINPSLSFPDAMQCREGSKKRCMKLVLLLVDSA